MTQNPYYPSGGSYGYGAPGAGAPGPVERPQPLTIAVWLMYVGAALSLVSVLSTFLVLEDIRDQAQQEVTAQNLDIDPDVIVNIAVAVGVGAGLLALALWIWMAVMNGRGRNWARIVATVLGALSLCGGLASFTNTMATAATVVLSLLQLAVAAVVVVLLWLPSSSAYYRAQGARR
jgi:hypothetical protein